MQSLLSDCIDVNAIYDEFSASIRCEINELIALRDAGESVIPEVSFAQLNKSGFSKEQAMLIRSRGCVVIRGTFPESLALGWNQDLEDYLQQNNYYSDLQAAIDGGDTNCAKHPELLDIYWSRPQVEVRQSTQLHELQRHLHTLWTIPATGNGSFSTELSNTYGDRVRVRESDDQTRGLPPHVDSCSMESWFSSKTIDRAYGSLLRGDWQSFNAFDAASCAITQRKPHAKADSMFRSYQGWMALTAQGARSGTLQLVPSSRCVAWVFLDTLRAFANGVDQMLPSPGNSYELDPERHSLLTMGLCELPQLRAGDTVWWHPNVVHGVESQNNSGNTSSVVYLGIAPDCERNRQYMSSQFKRFSDGMSPPDFPDTSIEKHYKNRAIEADLSELGARQMGRKLFGDTAPYDASSDD